MSSHMLALIDTYRYVSHSWPLNDDHVISYNIHLLKSG